LHTEGGDRDPSVAGDHVDQRAAETVVGVDHGDVAVLGGEERGLGFEVIAQVGVEVQVVLGQVRENRDIVACAADPAQGEGVAGDVHGGGGDPAFAHEGEEAVQICGLGGGEGGLDPFVTHPHLDGPDQAGVHARGTQTGLDQIGDRGLAAGAGGPDQQQVVRGVGEDPGGGTAESGAGVGDHEDRQARGGGSVGPGLVGHDCRGARAGDLVGEVCAVGTGTG